MSPEQQAALYDSAYIAGAKAGYNLGIVEDSAGLAQIIEARAGYLAVLRTTPPAAAPGEITQEQARAMHAALEEIAKGDLGLGYPHRDEGGRPTNTEAGGWGYITDNYDDCFDAGVAAGEWDAAQIATAALAGVPRE